MSVRDILQSAAGAGGSFESLIVVQEEVGSRLINAYRYTGAGFDIKYSDPSPIFSGGSYAAAFNPSNTAVVITHNFGSQVAAYAWSVSTGFGTKYSDPAVLPGSLGLKMRFSKGGGAVVFNAGFSAYAWSNSTGFGAKYAAPSPLPAGSFTSMAFSPTNDAFAYGHSLSPFITVYTWSDSTGIGTKYADPSVFPSGTVEGIDFSPNNDAIHCAHRQGNYMKAYGWNSSTGFGTSYTVPGLPRNGTSVAFHPSGNAVAYGFEVSSPRVYVYPWSVSTGFGGRFNQAGPSYSYPGNSNTSVSFNSTGNALAATGLNSPFVYVYPFSVTTGITSSTPLSLPGTSPNGASYTCVFSN